MPKNCSKDVSLVINHIDNVLTHGSAAKKLALKTMFGLEGVEHDDDFARYHLPGLLWPGITVLISYL